MLTVRILTAHVTEEVGPVETPPRHGVGAALSEAEYELVAQALTPPEGAALGVSAAAGALNRQSLSPLLLGPPQLTGVPKNIASDK